MTRKAAANYLARCMDKAGLTPAELAESLNKTSMAGRLWTVGEKKGKGRHYTVPSAFTLKQIAERVEGFSMDKYLALVHDADIPNDKKDNDKERLTIIKKPDAEKSEDRVTDGGMAPELIQGDVIEVKQVTLEDIVPGHTYFVIAGENKLVRIVRQSKSDKNKFILVPSNTEKYDEWEVEKSKISGIYKIISFKREL